MKRKPKYPVTYCWCGAHQFIDNEGQIACSKVGGVHGWQKPREKIGDYSGASKSINSFNDYK